MKLRRLASFAAASAVIIGMLGQGASMVLATGAHTQYWQGNGVTDGQLNNVDCTDGVGMLWIWTGDGDNVQISVDGEVVDGDQQGQGSWHFFSSWHDLAGLTAGDGGNVFVTYDGDVDNSKAVVTLSHGCEGTTTTTTTSSSSSTTTTTTSSSSTTTTTTTEPSTTTTTTTTEPSTTTTTTATTTSFTGSQGGETDVPTEPNTAAIETGGPSNPSSSVWMLIVALGLLLGSVVILTPAPSKTKR
jgi:hypothetical protein